jgi:hypothetical protein
MSETIHEIIGRIEEVCISEHPNFHKVIEEWGVIPAHWRDTIIDYETGELGEPEWIPENREGHRPELDGMSMADMWYYEKKCWKIHPPGFEGIRYFLRNKIEHRYTNS